MHVTVKTALNPATEMPISQSAADLVRFGAFPNEPAELDAIRALAAALITKCESVRNRNRHGNGAAVRHASLAITAAEEAGMWAVKAAAAPPAGGETS